MAAATASGTAGNLPGGTSIEVAIASPADGQVFAVPPGGTVDVPVTGTASIGEGAVVADTTLIYVVDGSGSTAANGGGLAGGDCGPDQNPLDPEAAEDEIIDCEILAALTLNTQAAAGGTIDEVALILFAGDAVTADLDAAAGDQPLAHPGADSNSNGLLDPEDALHSIQIAGADPAEASGFLRFSPKPTPDIFSTDFADAIDEALTVAALASNPNVLVVFLSDGAANAGAPVATHLPAPGGETFHTFAVGASSSCASNPAGLGSLQEIADLTGGTCTNVADPTNLPDILPDIIASELVALDLGVDGGAPAPIGNPEVEPDLTQPGPAAVAFQTMAAGLGPGVHPLCVTASGADAGGSGSVTDCVRVFVVTEGALDVKPGSCPNPFGMRSSGVLPVALVGTAGFDVAQVDRATLALEGVAPLRATLEDVATPFQLGAEPTRDSCTTARGDGMMDLAMKFDHEAVRAALGPVADGNVVVVTLTGQLTDGTGFQAQDVIWIRG